MIPKNLFMIWIGALPPFAKFAFEQYKKINPLFNANFVHYTVFQLEQLYFKRTASNVVDLLCIDLLDAILNNSRYQQLIEQQVVLLSKQGDVSFIQLFCDILRLELINRFGGIYIDCDTFPIRLFDDDLLNISRFLVYDKVSNFALYPNNYFIGSDGKQFWPNYFDGSASKIVQLNNLQIVNMNKSKTTDYLIRRVKFFKCKLTQNDIKPLLDSNDYFEHYSEFRWGTGQIESTAFDKLFDAKKILSRKL